MACLSSKNAVAPAPVHSPCRASSTSGGRVLTVLVQAKHKKAKQGYGGAAPNQKKAAQMANKNWRDSSGRPSKGYGAYRFANQYGDINDYSPVYDETTWSAAGDQYSLGAGALGAWVLLLVTLLSISVYLVYSTSQLAV